MEVGIQHHALAVLPLGNWPGTHCTGDPVGPRAGLNRCRLFHTHWALNPKLSSL